MFKTIIASICIVILAQAAFAESTISFSEKEFNFGKLPQHTAVSHTFWIRATGNEPVHITKVVPGCGCTKAPLQDSVIAPGDSTSIEIIFSAKSFRGYVSKKPYIQINDSEERIYLRIDSEIMPDPESIEPAQFVPYKLDVSQFTEAPRRKASFSIQNKSDKDMSIKLVDGAGKNFDVDLPKEVKAGQSAEGHIMVHKDKIESEFEQSFTIELGDGVGTRISLPVKRMYRVMSKK
ncbi:MAG: DUF1573 domain-containing protein [Calditrichaeota bacterium]|nr:MAG: DUF1573 domain-containing protein [Calditrichota bacterium]